jgi:uncharacterized protein YndB with AHSA1/START domain
MTQSATTTVRRQVLVNAPISEAFKVFTERFGDFKPREHNLLRAPIAETVFEPRVGGNIYDRAVDGTECRWARILAFEPPDRVVFSWDISPRWQLETNPNLTSEVEVRFFAEAPQRTRVELEHRNIDRHGPGWESVRDGSTTKPVGRCTCSAMRHWSSETPDAGSPDRVAATPSPTARTPERPFRYDRSKASSLDWGRRGHSAGWHQVAVSTDWMRPARAVRSKALAETQDASPRIIRSAVSGPNFWLRRTS